jgi:FkbM family methyltransferase
MEVYSQLGEDIFLFQNYINVPRKDIVAFEVSAYDGVTYSNTLALEKYHECKTVLVEPSPLNVKKIYASRPSASVHRVAIDRFYGSAEFLGHGAVSGVASNLKESYIEYWHLGQADRYRVMTVPMKAVTDIENVEYIDFLSIDVQGAEFNVLSSMDWSIPIGVVCIELEGQHAKNDEMCRGILRGMGFNLERRLYISEFWRNPNYERANSLFDQNIKMPLSNFDRKFFSDDFVNQLKENFY